MYQAFVVEIKQLRKHSNADRLQVATIFGNDVIVGLDMKIGDVAVYFPTDGKLGGNFAFINNLVRIKNEDGTYSGGYLDADKRKIGTLKLRGEKSDGLLLPITCLDYLIDVKTLKVGDTITVVKGELICEKYIVPMKRTPNTQSTKIKVKKEKTESFPLFQEHIDTSQYAYNKHMFKEGDLVYITLKMHGTSGRTSYALKETKKHTNKFLYPILNKLNLLPKVKKSWETVTGTRRVVLYNKKDEYHNDTFRDKYHNILNGKLNKGETVFYEIVGYTDSGSYIMGSCDNKKTKDKEFIKQYGETTNFTYGCEQGQSEMYVYRMTLTNEDGYVVEYPWEIVELRCEQMGLKLAPELDKFLVTTQEDLDERVNKFVEGFDPIGKSHLREGVVLRIENKVKFTAYKHKSFNFKVLEGIIKDADVPDLEENS